VTILSALPTMARNLWAHREIVRNFVARSLKIKYHGSFLGYLWSLIDPLVYMVVFYFLYVILAGRPQRGYSLSILLGVLTWRFFSSLLQDLTQALVGNQALIKRVYFPREVFVLSSVGFQLVSYGLSLMVVLPFMAFFGIAPTWRLAMLPATILLLVLFTTGIGMIASCLNARARDTREIVSLAVRVGFWLTPVFYTLDRIPPDWRNLYLLNPLAAFLTLVRAAVSGEPSDVPFGHLVLAAVLALGSFLAGAAIFQRWQGQAVKFL
jgi:homopolymeric O-antigen transport system permease protein